MLYQFVAIAFAATGADVSVLDRQQTAEDCTSYLEHTAPDGAGFIWVGEQSGEWVWIGNAVLACIPDNVDF